MTTTPELPMLSFASVGEIETRDGKPVTAKCEVEKIDIRDSRPQDKNKPVFKAYIPIQEITDNVGEIEEGDIIVVSHENEQVITVIRKDAAEKERRVALIEQLQAAIFAKR